MFYTLQAEEESRYKEKADGRRKNNLPGRSPSNKREKVTFEQIRREITNAVWELFAGSRTMPKVQRMLTIYYR